MSALSGQLEDCKAAIEELRVAFPDAEDPALLDAALLRKQKKSLEEQFAVLTVGLRTACGTGCAHA